MAIAYETLDRWAEEAASRFAGRRLRKVHAVDPHELYLSFQGEGAHLFITTRAPFQRIALIEDPPAFSGDPTPFARHLRAALGARRLSRVARREAERIIEIEFAGGPALLAELFGPRGNVVVVDPDGRVVASRFPLRRRGRLLRAGDPYEAPPPGRRGRPSEDAGASAGASALEDPRAVAASLERRERIARFAERKAEILRAIGRRLAPVRRARAAVEADRARASEAERLRRWGELLKMSLASIPRGAASVRVPDWFASGEEVEIPLRPDLSARGNVDAYFRRYRKAKAAIEALAARAAALAREEERLAAAEREAEAAAAGDFDGIEALAARVLPGARRGSGADPADRPAARPPGGPRSYVSRDGLSILVGRSARENDDLLARFARGRDIFLHVSERPGCFVIVRMPRERDGIPEETLRDAAALAVRFSLGRNAGPVEVSWTEVKHVRRIRGGPPGRVTIAGRRSIRASADPERLARIFGGQPEIDPAPGE
ncbi:MAG: DUF814 domain-containing protein [Planctomycetes bacterium]|nr:DUF814 domain-containing protein [Planctomycetota bacterium]